MKKKSNLKFVVLAIFVAVVILGAYFVFSGSSVTGAAVVILPGNNCKDTDGGKFPYTPGAITYNYLGMKRTKNDACAGTAKNFGGEMLKPSVYERFCYNGGPRYVLAGCANGCITDTNGTGGRGYCRPSETTSMDCTDSDVFDPNLYSSLGYYFNLKVRGVAAHNKKPVASTTADSPLRGCVLQNGVYRCTDYCPGTSGNETIIEYRCSDKIGPIVENEELCSKYNLVCYNGACVP